LRALALRLPSTGKSLLGTSLTEGLVLLANLLVLRVALHRLTSDDFGSFVLARRAVASLQLPMMLGMGLAIPWQLGRQRNHAPGQEAPDIRAGFLAGLVPGVVLLVICLAAPRQVAGLIFGTTALAELAPLIGFAVLALTTQVLVGSVFRGQHRFLAANTLQIVSGALLPLVAVALVPRQPAALLLGLALAWLIPALPQAVRMVRTGARASGATLRAAGRRLLGYGLPRVPGELALAFMFTLPAVILAHARGVTVAGQLSLALTFVTLVAAGVRPVALVLLPKAAAWTASSNTTLLRRAVRWVTVLSLTGSALGSLIAVLLATPLTLLLYGEPARDVIPLIRLAIPIAIPLTVYLALRGIVDGISTRAVNSGNLLLTLSVTTVLCLVKPEPEAMLHSLLASTSLLGVLTLYQAFHLLQAIEKGKVEPVEEPPQLGLPLGQAYPEGPPDL